ncbi:MAG: alpha/beta hydrolase [Alphaproteobacteria bacterium]|nr:alpha/beta hydrolase [Alphaproteobacteria bacterium]
MSEEEQRLAVRAAAPDWFHWAIAQQGQSRRVEVEGCSIHYLLWQPEAGVENPGGILFVHGGGAHAHWWSFIAPFFTEDRAVAAIDFSGMGDSGRREDYSSEVHVPEIAAVLADASLGGRPIIVGHSFGGFMAMCYGNRHGKNVSGMVFVDTPLRPEVEAKANPTPAYTRPKPVHPDLETILGRFRLGPAQPCGNGFILDYIARYSVTECDGGWTWKFDVAARGASHHDEPLADYLANLSCPKALIYGADSAMVTGEIAAYMRGLFAPGEPIICMPEAHHHLIFDQPLAFVAALRAILSGWDM